MFKKVSLRRIGIFSLIIFILSIFLLYLAHRYLFYDRLRHHLIEAIERSTKRKVTIAKFSPWSLKGFSISGLIVHDREGFDHLPLFMVKVIYIHHDLISFFSKGKGRSELRLVEPVLHLKSRNGELNIKDIINKKQRIDPFLGLVLLFPKIVYEDLVISLEEDGKKREIKGLYLEILRKKGKDDYTINLKTHKKNRNDYEIDIEAFLKLLGDSTDAEGRFRIVSLPFSPMKAFLPSYLSAIARKSAVDAEGSFHINTSMKKGLTALNLSPLRIKLGRASAQGEISFLREEKDLISLDLSFKDMNIYPVRNIDVKGNLGVVPLNHGGHELHGALRIKDCDSLILNKSGLRWENLKGSTSFRLIFPKEKGIIKVEDLSIFLSDCLEGKGRGIFTLSKDAEKVPLLRNADVDVRIRDLKGFSRSLKGLPLDMEGKVKISGVLSSLDQLSIEFDGALDLNDLKVHFREKGVSFNGMNASIPVKELIPIKKGAFRVSAERTEQIPWGWFKISRYDQDLFKFRDIKGGIRIERRTIEIRDMKYDLYRGNGEGSASIFYGHGRPFMNVETVLKGSNLEEFCRENRIDRINLKGQINGNLTLKAPPFGGTELNAQLEVEEPGGSISLSFLEEIGNNSRERMGGIGLRDIPRIDFRKARANFYTRGKGIFLDLAFYKLKFGPFFGFKINEIEVNEIPIESFRKALRGKG